MPWPIALEAMGASGGAVGPSGPLGVASQGGQQLSDRYGALPVDGSSIYLDPYTGERLAVDAAGCR